MKRRISRYVTFLMAGALLLALSVAVIPRFAYERPHTILSSLDELVPIEVDGWAAQRLEVADSQEMRGRVIRILRYDDMIYRTYRRGAIEVQVYVAYWKPGSVPYGQAGVHTPDTCWVSNGWVREERYYAQEIVAGTRVCKPAEIGRFSLRGQNLHVAFWHLVAGRVHSYEQYGWHNGLAGVRDRLPYLFKDLSQYGLNLAQEQLFVRISSNVPIKTLVKDPAFGQLLETLRPVGLFQDRKI